MALLLVFVPLISWASVWVLVDTEEAIVTIMNDTTPVMTFEDISLGRAGVTDLHLKGDDKTPRGEFRIVRINRNSRFRIFYEINYPTINHAQKALEKGLIDNRTFNRIKVSQMTSGDSPQNTSLGGHLGIHGLGDGDPQMHRTFNWTNGCVALTNDQVDLLDNWVQLGTKVVIK